MTTEEQSSSSPRHQGQPQQPPGIISKIVAFILGAGLLVLAFMFSLVALAILAVGGLAVWGWLWWKTRAIRQQMNDMHMEMKDARQSHTSDNGHIIEGEVIRESTTPVRPERLLR